MNTERREEFLRTPGGKEGKRNGDGQTLKGPVKKTHKESRKEGNQEKAELPKFPSFLLVSSSPGFLIKAVPLCAFAPLRLSVSSEPPGFLLP